jgi:XTP/dITP diphosphohydrolase
LTRPRIILLVTSPRLPPGLLTAQAWDVLRAYPVLAGADGDLTSALRAQDVAVEVIPPDAAAVLAVVAARGTVVWLAGPAGDQALARELGLWLARSPDRAELELLFGSWDPLGARLLDVVSVIDRLASPGGDPWLREVVATDPHRRLAGYLLEEAYEAYDAIQRDDLGELREELGDVLMQVVLHARLAQDHDLAWSVDDVAGAIVDKLIRRNPHVFAGAAVADVGEVIDNWDRIKRAEKARDSVMDGIALAQPALALAAKVLSRARRAGAAAPVAGAPVVADEAELGAALLRLVAAAEAAGLDAEAALRRAALDHADAVRAAEAETAVRSDPAIG